ncbi:hypothetical protein N9C79_02620 [Acidimicrobiia bacterium]|nr:hypothetical protein [Acidimicrobiia bacterium]
MTNIEKKVMTFLVLILLINSLLVLANNSNLVSYIFNLDPENTSGTLIVFSLIGLHAVFALLTMCLSLIGSKFIFRYYTLGFTVLAPLVFLFVNFRAIISYQTDSYYFLPFSFLVYYLFIKKREKIQTGINMYIKTLVNPLDTPWY